MTDNVHFHMDKTMNNPAAFALGALCYGVALGSRDTYL